MSPYLLTGFVFAGLLHVYVKQEHTAKYLGKKNFRSVVNAALLGVPLPLCSCGVIPTGVSLSKNGATKGAAVSFLISTPQTGADSVMMTYSMLGLPFAIIRPIAALVTGIFGGSLTNLTDKTNYSLVSENNQTTEKEEKSKLYRFFNYAFVEFLQDISKWLLVGLAIAALISVVVPDNLISTYIHYPILNMLIVFLIAGPLYVCATGSVPIAAVLMMKGISPGAALVFLMAGPATNAATLTVLGKTLGRKAFYAYLISITTGAFAFGLIMDYLFPVGFFTVTVKLGGNLHHEMLPYWVGFGSTIILGLLITNGYYQKYFNKNHSHLIQENTMETIKISVSGMTCNHCKATVEKNVGKIEGIQSINADIVKNIVEISGENVDLAKVEEVVNNLGYEYKGKAK
jgi:hypothetical protein